MIEGPALLAVCEGTSVEDQVFGVIIALALAVFWLWMTWLAVGSGTESAQRRLLGALWIACAAVGSIVIASLHGDAGENLLIAFLLTLAIGVGGVLYSKRASVLRGVGVAITGGMVLPVFIAVVLIIHVSVGGGCLGDELG
jgi:hypothetical protein